MMQTKEFRFLRTYQLSQNCKNEGIRSGHSSIPLKAWGLKRVPHKAWGQKRVPLKKEYPLEGYSFKAFRSNALK
jgi:hypothetical protein